MLPQHKKDFLRAVQFTEDEIAAVESAMSQQASKAQGEGLRSKETQQAQPEPVATPVAQPTPEPQPQAQPTDGVDAQAEAAKAFIVKALEPLFQSITAEINTLKQTVAAMQQQQVSSTPAASLAAKSIAQQPGEHVLSGRGPQGPKENNADKEAGQAIASVTGVPFIDNIIAINSAKQNGA